MCVQTASATGGRRTVSGCEGGPVLVPEPRTQGRTSDLRYEANDEDPQLSRWPELKARISTAGFDPGVA